MSMIEVKTAELIEPALDWAVAQVEGKTVGILPNGSLVFGKESGAPCCYSRKWGQGGPLLDKYYVTVGADGGGSCKGYIPICDGMTDRVMRGPTRLVAGCRAIVAAKLGDVVQVPAELVQEAPQQ